MSSSLQLSLCLPLGLVSTALPLSLQIPLNNPVRPARTTSPRVSRCTNEAHCCREGLRLSSCLSNKQTRRLIRPNPSPAIGAICLSVHVSVHILQRKSFYSDALGCFKSLEPAFFLAAIFLKAPFLTAHIPLFDTAVIISVGHV